MSHPGTVPHRPFGPSTITAGQMREVDRIMVEDLHIELIQMMEMAGRNLADLALRLFHPATAAVLAGPGGNGGGGLVAARHLANRGVDVHVALSHAARDMRAATAHQLDILERIGIPAVAEPRAADLIVDSLIGYGLAGTPSGRTAELIAWGNAASAPVLALDTPSGLDVTTGDAYDPCLRATATMTLAAVKPGLLRAAEHVGALWLADIGVPPQVFRGLGIDAAPAFRDDAVVRVR